MRKHSKLFFVLILVLVVYLLRFMILPTTLNFPGPYIGYRIPVKLADELKRLGEKDVKLINIKDKNGDFIYGFITFKILSKSVNKDGSLNSYGIVLTSHNHNAIAVGNYFG